MLHYSLPTTKLLRAAVTNDQVQLLTAAAIVALIEAVVAPATLRPVLQVPDQEALAGCLDHDGD